MGSDWQQAQQPRVVEGWHVPEWHAKPEIPMSLEQLRGFVAEVLAAQTELEALAIVTRGAVRGALENYDNWNGGTYTWKLEIGIRATWFGKLQDSALIEESIARAANFTLRGRDNHTVTVTLTVGGAMDPNWQENAERLLRGEGVNNQGRVRSDNVATIQVDGLLFRSLPEVNFYTALKATGVVFAPLAVFIQGGTNYSRLEPDFIILKDGILMVVELDGETFHQESPVIAHQRLNPLWAEGAKVVRYEARRCNTLHGANQCVAEALSALDKFARQR